MKVYHCNIIETQEDVNEYNRTGGETRKGQMHRDIIFGCPLAAMAAFTEGFYKHVANVDTADLDNPLDFAFSWTQNLSQAGWANEAAAAGGKTFGESTYARVSPVLDNSAQADIRRRSTMVGDIVELNNKFYMVDKFGFTQLPQLGQREA